MSVPGGGEVGAAPRHEVLLRAADAGRTYVATTWLDGHEARLAYEAVDREDLDPLLEEIRRGLVQPLPGESTLEATRRAMTEGVLADPERGRALGERLGGLLVPREHERAGGPQPEFWAELYRRAAEGPVRVRITPSRSTALVPWELMRGPDGRTLLDVATVVYEVPTAALADRALSDDPVVAPAFDPAAGVLRTIDPRVPAAAGLGRVLEYDAVGRSPLLDALGIDPHERNVTRERLSRQLCADERPGRWLYAGHVSTREDQPGAASLHLSDTSRDGEVVLGTAALLGGVHRPFTALDLVLGTAERDEESWLEPGVRLPGPGGLAGSRLWPMPARVALIACASGSDHAATEAFGLVVAAMNNGAQLVTSTRWAVPTDAAFREVAGVTAHPTTALAVAVDRAQGSADPVAALREWQRAEHAAWLATGDLRHSPLLFAGVTTYEAHVQPGDARRGGEAREATGGRPG